MQSWSLGVLLLVAELAGVTSAARAQLTIRLEPQIDHAAAPSADRARVRFVITNTGDRAVSFLRHSTPLVGFEHNFFAVTRDGEPLPYLGKLVLRSDPTAGDWVRLTAGVSLEGAIALDEAYDLRAAGHYTIRFRFPIGFQQADAVGEEDGQELVESNTLGLDLDEAIGLADPAQVFMPEEDFRGCTAAEKTALQNAGPSGRNLAASSYNYLIGVPSASRPSDALYRKWFGAYTSNRYAGVTNAYSNLYNVFGYAWSFACTSCAAEVIAYVYAHSTYNVWICPLFFQYASTARASFLLHEASHWNAVRATADYAYGSTSSARLAAASPDRAIYNADNYRYFSLSTP